MITLNFNPYACGNNTLSKFFKRGGPAVKFYFLYRQGHLTNQYFNRSCYALQSEFVPQEIVTPLDFKRLLQRCIFPRVFTNGDSPIVSENWIIKHWDYFNINVNKSLDIKHKKYGRWVVTKII